MSHRTFNDQSGTKWEVWTVVPTKVERRTAASDLDPETDRRRKTEYRVALGPALANGWLCFESDHGKRRLAPYPESWEGFTDGELSRLLDAATPVASRPRRLIE